jgi:preprotein translocase subunit SecF
MAFRIVKYRRIWFAFSATTVGLSILFFAMWGLKEGIDFTGGSLVTVGFEQRPTPVEVERTLAPLDLGSVVIQPVGDTQMNIRTKTLDEQAHADLLKKLNEAHGKTEELRYDSIGPSIGAELRGKAWQAILVAFLAILAYIAYAFRKVSQPVQSWKYGIVTVMQAFRDVMIPVGVFSVLGHYYGVEVGTPFIAAILTVLGYSITDCIVVMDRIRENLHKKSGSFEDIVEMSIHQTLLRSFNTSMATLLTLFAIFFFGGRSLHDFTLALIIGIVVGTYSSIFVSAPTLVELEKWGKKK